MLDCVLCVCVCVCVFCCLLLLCRCELLPEPVVEMCKWEYREDGFRGASIPRASLRRVVCPAALHNRSGCLLQEDQAFQEY